jgi:penicillin-binding protein 2
LKKFYEGKSSFKRQIQQRNSSYKDGKYDTIAVQGEDINLTLDAELQRYGEQLMINKRGIVVEPKTGEILALLTAPSYDPSILVRQRSKTILYCITTPLQNHFTTEVFS